MISTVPCSSVRDAEMAAVQAAAARRRKVVCFRNASGVFELHPYSANGIRAAMSSVGDDGDWFFATSSGDIHGVASVVVAEDLARREECKVSSGLLLGGVEVLSVVGEMAMAQRRTWLCFKRKDGRHEARPYLADNIKAAMREVGLYGRWHYTDGKIQLIVTTWGFGSHLLKCAKGKERICGVGAAWQ